MTDKDEKPKRKRRGRETVITEQVIDALVEALRVGATHEIACQYAGIGKTAFYRRLSLDANFAETINNAEGRGAIRHLANINKVAQGDERNGVAPDWKASAWLLERRYPEQYGRRVVDNNIKGELTIKTFGDVINEGGIAHDNNNQNADNPDNEDEFA